MKIFEKIFGTKKHKEVKIDKALNLFRSEIEQKKYRAQKKDLDKKFSIQKEKLKEAIDRLKKTEAPDELGKGAERAKESYCEKVLHLLDRSRICDLDKFLAQAKPTPRQLAHFTHFFAKPFSSLRKKLKNCEKLYRKMERLNDKKEREREIEELIYSIKRKEIASEKIPLKLNSLKKRLSKIKSKEAEAAKSLHSLDGSEVATIKRKVQELEARRDRIFRDIASALSPVKRIGRKYAYYEGKIELKGYLEKPLKKFLNEPAKLKKFLADSLKLAENGELKLDSKKLQKAQEILASFEQLNEKRKLINEIGGLLAEKKKELAKQSKKLVTEKESAVRRLKQIGAKKRELKVKHKKLLKKSVTFKKEISELKKKVEEIISLALDQEIKLK